MASIANDAAFQALKKSVRSQRGAITTRQKHYGEELKRLDKSQGLLDDKAAKAAAQTIQEKADDCCDDYDTLIDMCLLDADADKLVEKKEELQTLMGKTRDEHVS